MALAWLLAAFWFSSPGLAQVPAREPDWAALRAAALASPAPGGAVPAPGPAGELDALGRPVSPETRVRYEAILAEAGGRRFAEPERDFLLAVLNAPPLDPRGFRGRDALVRHFAAAGVRMGDPAGTGLAGSDLWRLVRAARAAASAYRIPPAVLLCLTFRESGFRQGASAWTTSAKGVAQMTNPAVAETIARIRGSAELRASTGEYARLLGARMPERVEGAPDVDAANTELRRLRASGAPAEDIRRWEREKRARIAAHKDEPGHIFNIETNFGLGAAYLAYLRRARLAELGGEPRAWLTAVAAYNQGIGTANELIYRVHAGPADFERRPFDEVFGPAALGRLRLSPERRHELWGEVDSVRRCGLD